MDKTIILYLCCFLVLTKDSEDKCHFDGDVGKVLFRKGMEHVRHEDEKVLQCLFPNLSIRHDIQAGKELGNHVNHDITVPRSNWNLFFESMN